ncbi:hypothetical protein I4U23_025993 [Adineta vaga]|nr:hypothetical protein I4U23_025993 [Adineta vaga]
MSQQCAVPKCHRQSRWLCDCCQENLCLQHINEHNAALISQLNPLAEEINILDDRLKSIHTQHAIGDCRRKLEKWRDECYEKIDRFFEQKFQELDRLVHEKVAEQREKIARVQTKVAELIRAQETTRKDIVSLTATIRQLGRTIDKIEQTCFTVHTRPLIIDNALVIVKEKADQEPCISTLAPVYKTINRSAGSYALASNDRYLLIHQQPNLCLVDQEMNIVKQTLWSYDAIYDMCWSATLNRFIVIEENDVLLVDENTMTIDNVQTIETGLWLSCTCSNTSLYLSTGERASSIKEYRLLPSIQLIRELKSPHTCSRDEVISGIVYNNGRLALIIVNITKKTLRIESRDAETLNRLWSLRLDIICNQNRKFGCCALRSDEWLVADYETKRLLYITKDGKVKKVIDYTPEPYHVSLFGANILAVSTKNDIRMHKI